MPILSTSHSINKKPAALKKPTESAAGAAAEAPETTHKPAKTSTPLPSSSSSTKHSLQVSTKSSPNKATESQNAYESKAAASPGTSPLKTASKITSKPASTTASTLAVNVPPTSVSTKAPVIIADLKSTQISSTASKAAPVSPHKPVIESKVNNDCSAMSLNVLPSTTNQQQKSVQKTKIQIESAHDSPKQVEYPKQTKASAAVELKTPISKSKIFCFFKN